MIRRLACRVLGHKPPAGYESYDDGRPCTRCGRPNRHEPFLGAAVQEWREITEDEHQAALARLTERYGEIPPSLQWVIDHGGRIGLPGRRDPS